ncbi:MAG: nitroreductase/quinone reductase family protein [Acidimicrobiia bacterium]|nr:nitroreductase/quinone reductase family protein [Acidimicrobiia bacterium]
MNLTEEQVTTLRGVFRALNRSMLLLWRLGLGGTMASPNTGYVLVLTTTGRKSGERRLVPLNFAEEGTSVYCLAGFGKRTHWLLNLQADPRCELWLPDGRRVHGSGTVVVDEAKRLEMIRKILVRAGFATKLAEPGLDPRTAPDDVIGALGERYGHRYEVVEIKQGEMATGAGGPGDLAWVWPVAAVGAVLSWLLLRRR